MTAFMSVIGFLILAAFICTIASACSKCPVWVPVLLLCIIALLQILPLK